MNAIGSASHCPYCAKDLGAPIKRKRQCPSCGETIVVRQGIPLTVDDAAIRDWSVRLAEFEVTEAAIRKHRQDLSTRFRAQASVNDAVWGILNQLVVHVREHRRRGFAYQEMARLVRSEGRNPTQYLIEAQKQELLEIRTYRAPFVCTSTCNDDYVCATCRKHERKPVALDDALAEPLAGHCTSEGGCRCFYTAWIE